LDVAGGTGDIALRILDRAREKFGNREIEVEIVDLNEGMLDEGRKRVAKTLYYNSELDSRPTVILEDTRSYTV
jgi:2-methoxy-6-polyprenyl-1,4-benzoquinol methylase